jgi:cation:H+ antiporter
MLDLLVLLAAVLALWIGTEITLRAAVRIAHHYGVSETVIGVAVLAVGTDLPELTISIDAGLETLAGNDASGIVTGTAVGSTLGQIGFVLGLAALMAFLTLSRREIYRHGAFLLGSVILLFATGLDAEVSRTEGAILVISYLLYLTAVFEREHQEAVVDQLSINHAAMFWLMLAAGIAIVVASAELTVDKARELAEHLGVSQSVIAIFIVGLGSSLPELVISLGALQKKRIGLSVGNIIGSNVFDTLLPVGIAALITPVTFESQLLWFDVPFLFVLTALVLGFFYRGGLGRREGTVILSAYFAYAFFKIFLLT